MAIKTRNSRRTYRSNVKIRPLQQNGLEAQYQGLDITEVNIDHAGLGIIGRGGFQTRRDIRKVRKQYIVDVPAEEHNPTAEMIFLTGSSTDSPLSPFHKDSWAEGGHSLSQLNGETFVLTGSSGTIRTFEFTTDSSHTNGASIPSRTEIAVNIADNDFSIRELMFAITGSIEAQFDEGEFRFKLYSSGSKEEKYGYDEPIDIEQDKIVFILSSSIVSSASLASSSISFVDVITNEFADQSESHEWRLNGYHKDYSNERMFYEDIRVDTIQSVVPHSVRRDGSFFRDLQFPVGNPRNNYDANINSIANDPTGEDRFTIHDSNEILIRQYPKREEILGTHKDYFKWHEDVYYVHKDQQTWSLMTMYAEMYGSTLFDQITRLFEQIYVSDDYVDDTPMSGRVDVFDRLKTVFDLDPTLPQERHRNSVFNQYLDPQDDFINLQENRFPKDDCNNADLAFEDVQGVRQGSAALWNDYFDQEPLEVHDYKEEERYTRIDSTMLDILTFNENRDTHIDKREWQETAYIHTATGFINSQVTGQDGIIYREMKR